MSSWLSEAAKVRKINPLVFVLTMIANNLFLSVLPRISPLMQGVLFGIFLTVNFLVSTSEYIRIEQDLERSKTSLDRRL